jgi:fatty-acyl-CoA synthase
VRRLLGETVGRGPARPASAAAPSTSCRAPVAAHRPPPAAPGDLALVQFSSGTTVEPKPVALSHRAVMAQAAALNGHWPDLSASADRGLLAAALPRHGLIGCVFPALELPSVMTLIGPELFVARPAIWLRTLSRYRATISPAPNFAYALCVHKVTRRRARRGRPVGLAGGAQRRRGGGAGVLRAFPSASRPGACRPRR